MNEEWQLIELKDRLIKKRLKLNNLVRDNLDKEQILELSKELDVLINEYHKIVLK